MDDKKVFLEIKDKDEKMMAFVIQKYSKLLWKIASGVLINAASAEDIEECVADTFIHLWMNPHKYNPDKGKLSSYLSMVARSKAIDRYRKKKIWHIIRKFWLRLFQKSKRRNW